MTRRTVPPLALLFAAGTLSAQVPAPQTAPIDGAARRAVVTELARILDAKYVFADRGAAAKRLLDGNLAAGRYDSIADGRSLAKRLTADLLALLGDKHLGVGFRVAGFPAEPEHDPAAERGRLDEMRPRHFGFATTEVLPGNVGLLRIDAFMNPEGEVRDTAIAALRRLAGVDALLIDLRTNEGGEPEMVALVVSALFPRGTHLHLNDLRYRAGDRVQESWTEPALDIGRIAGPVFTVTSRETFSAGEELVSDLKHLKRATQVGETTGGGANPGELVRITERFAAFVPTGRAVNPITKSNWEGVGNTPEIAVPAGEALKRAYLEALDALAAKAPAERRATWRALRAKAERGEVALP